MEVIKINDSIYEQRPKYIGKNSNLYEIDGILYKIFDTNDPEILKRKQAKSEFLNSMNLTVKPIDLIEINGVIKGYTEIDTHLLPVNFFKGDTKYKLEILKLINEEAYRLLKMGIYFNQMNRNNILTDGKTVYFSSIDDAKVENLDFDSLDNDSKLYLRNFEADEYFINYLLNLFTVSYLKNIWEDHSLECIRECSLPFIINNKENRVIAKNMISLTQKEDIKPFIEKTKRYHLF